MILFNLANFKMGNYCHELHFQIIFLLLTL